jgi:hypothetical protein
MLNPSQPVRIARARDGLVIGEIANVCVVVWRGPVTRPRFEAQREGLADVVRRHPAGAGFLCVIEPTAAPPNDELRRAAADMIAAHESSLRCIACVVEGTGFVSAVARSALSGMALLLGSRKVPLSVFGTVRASTTWMAPRVDLRDASLLARSVESMRAELEPWRAGAS